MIDFSAVLVGKGNLDAGRGIPLAGRGIPLGGRAAALGCLSIMMNQLGSYSRWSIREKFVAIRALMSDVEEREKECGGGEPTRFQLYC